MKQPDQKDHLAVGVAVQARLVTPRQDADPVFAVCRLRRDIDPGVTEVTAEDVRNVDTPRSRLEGEDQDRLDRKSVV